MVLEVHSDPTALGALAGEWTKLLASADRNTIFATPEWAETCWRSFCAGREFCLLAMREGSELVGVVPLAVEQVGDRRLARFLPYLEVTDYEDIVARRGLEHDVWRQALAYLDQQPWDLDLHNIPGASPTIAFFRQLGQQDRHSVTVEVEDVCPVITPLTSRRT
jgi:CelD/BcsL family acetyltransferase involved in cellulose biosynthesis